MGTIANFMKDSDKEFEKAIHEQKDYAKAQRIILEQESKIRGLKDELASMQNSAHADQKKIAKLEEAIKLLSKAVGQRRQQLQLVA